MKDDVQIDPTATIGAAALVGRWFHTTKECPRGQQVAVWQGQVLATPTPDHLLVQLYEWVMGQASTQKLIALDAFVAMNPVFYTDDAEMSHSYRYGSISHCCAEQDCYAGGDR